ncbi:hypothetical protein AMATHDRAFT_47850 [Amanita thiersii Skay4041]|uniref:Uncharacterized protein n=1 Tax=Amanita thiersii Skay4041 TaxID=703135 RepID=A0A2A9NQJ7_9AGAR|nr:hypothetical protein AMATHDRAFT_47850 [Amanita thiersii Skay4041]
MVHSATPSLSTDTLDNIPVHLPPELLRTIFALATDKKFNLTQDFTNDDRIRLSHVCSSWRSVLLGMKELWSDMVIDLEAHPRILAVASRFLSRADGVPLSISVRMNGAANYAPRDPSADEFIDKIILPYAAFTQSLRLYVPFRYISMLLTLPFALSFPILESLSLRQASYGILSQTAIPTTPHLSFPRLHTFEFGARLPEHKSLLEVPQLSFIQWTQITTLMIRRHIAAKTAYDILATCTGLRTLWANLNSIDPDERARLYGSPGLYLPHLERLHIRFCTSMGFSLFLSLLNLPSIRDLALKETDGNGLGWSSVLDDFLLNRCGSHLENIFISNSRYDDELEAVVPGERQFFLQKHALTLRRLSVSCLPLTGGQTVRQLISGEMCPQLEALSLNLCPIDDPFEQLDYVLSAVKDVRSEGRQPPVKDLYLYNLCLHPTINKAISTRFDSQLRKIRKCGWRNFVSHIYDCSSCAHDPQVFESDWFGYSA